MDWGIQNLKALQIERLEKKPMGKKGEEFWIWLQLKVIADIGIIGLPKLARSTFLSKFTRGKT